MLMDNLQAVFIDRDGTMGGTGHFIHPRDFELFPFALAKPVRRNLAASLCPSGWTPPTFVLIPPVVTVNARNPNQGWNNGYAGSSRSGRNQSACPYGLGRKFAYGLPQGLV